MKKLKTLNIVKIVSIISFCLIILNGSMICMPFLLYLIISVFNVGEISQTITSIIGICGLILVFKEFGEKVTLKRVLKDLLAFMFLIIPLIERLNSIPIKLFDYLTFKIPIILFLVLYLISTILLTKECLKVKQNPL